MKYGSVCSGIEAASVAWEAFGWQASFLSEIETFPRSLLEHHYPSTPLHGDFTTIQDGMYEPIDLLVGGTPCQSFSVAGLRKGLDDPRGNLMLGYGALAKRLRPRWLVWENVPGVLSSNGGRDFGTFLAMLGQLGYGFAYRVLDAQYFGVAQRRRRVFVVGYLGDWRRAAAVLFERDGLCGNTAPRREAGKEVAGTISSRTTGGGGLGTDFECSGGLQAFRMQSFGEYSGDGSASAMKARDYKDATDHVVHGTQDPCVSSGTAFALGRNNGAENALMSYGIPGNWIGRAPENGGNAVEPMIDVSPCQTTTDQHGIAYTPFGVGEKPDVAHCLRSGASKADKHESTTYIAQQMAVRRLTPTECERLQGFPDGYTLVPHRGKPSADGPRYKALGNSMAVPVMRWIGERIQAVESIKAMSEAA